MQSSIAESYSDQRRETSDEVLGEFDNDANDDREEAADVERSNDNPFELERSGIL